MILLQLVLPSTPAKSPKQPMLTKHNVAPTRWLTPWPGSHNLLRMTTSLNQLRLLGMVFSREEPTGGNKMMLLQSTTVFLSSVGEQISRPRPCRISCRCCELNRTRTIRNVKGRRGKKERPRRLQRCNFRPRKLKPEQRRWLVPSTGGRTHTTLTQPTFRLTARRK